MEWARSSFRQVKRLSLGDTTSLPSSQEKSRPRPVLPRERANSTPAPVVMKNKKGMTKSKVATGVKRRFKVKRSKSGTGRRVNSVPSLVAPIWLSRCSHWLGHRRGSYRFGGIREDQSVFGEGQRVELGPKIKNVDEGVWCKKYSQQFHMVGQDSVGGPLVASLTYSPSSTCSLTVRLRTSSQLCSVPPSICYTSLLSVLRHALPRLNVVRLQPILCPQVGQILAKFDQKYPLVGVEGGRAVKGGEEEEKEGDLLKLRETLMEKTETFLDESGFSVNYPKSPRTPGCMSFTIPSPNLMRKISPFKIRFLSPGPGAGKKKGKVTDSDDKLDETEDTAIESIVSVTNSVFVLGDHELPTSEKSSTYGDHMSPTSGNSPTSIHQELPNLDIESASRHLVQEVGSLRQEILQLRLQNNSLENEVCRLSERETKLTRDLISANSIIESLNSLELE